MKLTARSVFRTELSSHEIRAFTAHMAHPDDPLAGWRFEFDEWRKAYAEFVQMERERFLPLDLPPPLMLRQHRYVLFLLMTQGEELAMALMQSVQVTEAERKPLLDQVDAFLGSLCDSWHTWHGEALSEHREALAKFFS